MAFVVDHEGVIVRENKGKLQINFLCIVSKSSLKLKFRIDRIYLSSSHRLRLG